MLTGSMLTKIITIFTAMGMSVLLVKSDLYKRFNPEQSYATANNYHTQENKTVTKMEFGQTKDDQKVYLYTLTNTNGLVAKITNYGATLTELHLPDNSGQLDDVVLGFDSLEDYFTAKRYLYYGAIVGRVANRIKDAQFTLNGEKYELAANAGSHHIHGGKKGFDKVVWKAEPINSSQGQALKLTYLSPDGEEGYPGDLTVTAIYTLTNDNQLKLEMTATTNKPTPVNLVNHSYWNLAGHGSGNILGQYLTINADRYTPTNEQRIPTGEIKSVKDTPYDFTQPQLIGDGINQLRNTLKQNYPGGYDLNYVLNGESEKIKLAATVYEPKSGRVMELHSNQPGIQFFSGNLPKLRTVGKGDVVYTNHQGLCLETQHFPDSVNQPNFPSVILHPGETYRHLMVYKFYTKQNNLGEIIAPNTQVEKVAGGFKFTEGPVWHPDGFLLFSDIPANTIYKWQPDQKTEIFRQPSGNANGNTLDRSGRLVTAEHSNRRLSLTQKDGKIITLASHYQGKRLNSPNDLAVKSDGSIYFTDPPYGIKSEQEELGFYGVYRLAPDGTLTLLVDDFVRPNGIVFSPDETKLYVNDSERGHIRVFDVKPDGMLENGKLFAELKPPSKEGAADGMKVDIQGNVYSTGPGGVWIFDPSGNLLGIIEVPEAPANLAWGDSDYQTLYITARNSLYRIRLKIKGMP
ncbi:MULTISPECIES: galactose-1-epimerase [Moorena]|uniref:Galactose mutarotase family enzyme n=4 Tax=Moorena TaxID=1155738 RepID=F4XSM3_9CYAN|nr:galactose-1-epimerase [Moorena producens]EGJ32436.1 galactose mutarotase family enzyme [Moorena producens 3L]